MTVTDPYEGKSTAEIVAACRAAEAETKLGTQSIEADLQCIALQAKAALLGAGVS